MTDNEIAQLRIEAIHLAQELLSTKQPLDKTLQAAHQVFLYLAHGRLPEVVPMTEIYNKAMKKPSVREALAGRRADFFKTGDDINAMIAQERDQDLLKILGNLKDNKVNPLTGEESSFTNSSSK